MYTEMNKSTEEGWKHTWAFCIRIRKV